MMLQNERKAATSSIAQVLDIDNGKSREVSLFCSVATKQTKGSLLRQKVVTKQTRGNEAAAGYSATADLPLLLLLRFRLTDAECYMHVTSVGELALNASYM